MVFIISVETCRVFYYVFIIGLSHYNAAEQLFKTCRVFYYVFVTGLSDNDAGEQLFKITL